MFVAILALFGIVGGYVEVKTVANVAVAESKGENVLTFKPGDISDVKKQFADEAYLRPCVGAAQTHCSYPDHVTGQ